MIPTANMSAEKTDILAQRPQRLGQGRRLGLGAALLLLPALTVVTAFGIAPDTTAPGPQRSTEKRWRKLSTWLSRRAKP